MFFVSQIHHTYWVWSQLFYTYPVHVLAKIFFIRDTILQQVTTSTASGTVNQHKVTNSIAQKSEINQAWFTTRDDKQALHNTGNKG